MRDAVRDHILRAAQNDPRIVSAAVVGSLADGPGDEWSDLDLTFGVAADASVSELLEAWMHDLAKTFDAAHLLDVATSETTYRVFLLPQWMQVDLSFTAKAALRAPGEAFRQLFGPYDMAPSEPSPEPDQFFAWGALYARHADVGIRRGRLGHPEYCVSGVRDHALTLACLRRDLPLAYGKGSDSLPAPVAEAAEDALVRSVGPDELRRALRALRRRRPCPSRPCLWSFACERPCACSVPYRR